MSSAVPVRLLMLISLCSRAFDRVDAAERWLKSEWERCYERSNGRERTPAVLRSIASYAAEAAAARSLAAGAYTGVHALIDALDTPAARAAIVPLVERAAKLGIEIEQ